MQPARFRSKPVEVEAVQVHGPTYADLYDIAHWCGGYAKTGGSIMVPTINGEAEAAPGHWIVKGPNDFYPCDPDTFATRWEPI